MSLIVWIDKNKFPTVVFIALAFFVLCFFRFPFRTILSPSGMSGAKLADQDYTTGVSRSDSIVPAPEYTPQTDAEERLVIQESDLSLQVESVIEVRNKILDYTKTNGGYMVSANVSNPQDAPTAIVIIRIPFDKLDFALDNFHSLSIKVVSENLSGRDVTDQYIDIDSRLETLRGTKEKFESILAQATKIEDITNLTREIIYIQNQTDVLKGRQESLVQNAQLAKLTIYLSTDEFALPYTPSETFRPKVIFKLAVRSLIGFARSLATYAIWIGVYSVVWITALGIFMAIKRWHKRRQMGNKPMK